MPAPGGSIGTAFVTILPNTDRFTATLVVQLRGASSAASSAGTEAARSVINWDALGRSISESGSNAVSTAGDFVALGAGADFATDQIQDLNKTLAASGVIRGGGLFGGPPGKGIATDLGSAFRDASNLVQGFIGVLTLVTPTVNVIIAALVGVVSLLGAAVIAATAFAVALGATAIAMGVAAYRWRNLLASANEDAETWRGALIAIEAEAFNMVETLVDGFSSAGEAGTDMWTAVGEAGVRFLQMMQPIVERVTASVVNFMSAFSGTGGESPFLDWMRRWLQEWKVLGNIMNEGIEGGGGLLGFFEKYEEPAKAFLESIAKIINALRKMSAQGLGLDMDQLAEFIRNIGDAAAGVAEVFPRFSNALVTVGLELSRFLLALMPIITQAFLVGEAILKGIVAPIVTGLVKALEFVMTLPIVDWLIAVAGGFTLVAFAISKLTLGRLPFALLMRVMIAGLLELSTALGTTILSVTGLTAAFEKLFIGMSTTGMAAALPAWVATLTGAVVIIAAVAAAVWALVTMMRKLDEINRAIAESTKTAFRDMDPHALDPAAESLNAFAGAYENSAAALNDSGFWGVTAFRIKHFGDVVFGGLSDTTLIAREVRDEFAETFDAISQGAKEAVSAGTPWTDMMIDNIQRLQDWAGAGLEAPNLDDFITGYTQVFNTQTGRMDINPIYDEDAFNNALELYGTQGDAAGELQEVLNRLNYQYDINGITTLQYAEYMDILNNEFETGVSDVDVYALKVEGAANTIAEALIEVGNSGDVATGGIKKFGDALGVSIVDFRDKAVEAFTDVAGGLSGSGEKITEWFLEQQAAIKNWKLEMADSVNFVSQAWSTLAEDANLTGQEILTALENAAEATKTLTQNMKETIDKGLSDEALQQITSLPAEQQAVLFATLAEQTRGYMEQANRWVERGGDFATGYANTLAGALDLTMQRLTTAVEIMVASILNIDPSEVSSMVEDIVSGANAETAKLKDRQIRISYKLITGTNMENTWEGHSPFGEGIPITPAPPLPDLGKVQSDWQPVGIAATKGMEQGLVTGTASVEAAGAALGISTVAATAKSIGAASPATKFVAIGNSAVEGLVLGVSQKSHLLTIQMRGIGANMAQGLREGLLQNLSTVADEVVTRLQEIVAAAKRELREDSPSQVFHEIGFNMAEGMRLGMAEGMERVRFDVGKQTRFDVEAMGMRTNAAVQQISGRPRLDGDLRIRDWRSGIASLDGELAWESLVRRS